jgi:ABC-type multidrug transport system ATPase subunit
VKGINVKMFQGQIFALLGQNGAGKTTTISMLTGLLPATGGKASVFNKDMFRDM